ncbi:MAG: diacylglycerol kinase family lipid kinase [Candidatus Bipolaricaulis sp.]|nr:diacylglycerol kinase family lipid kinase [Candidatus Bipolaricaulis sp.]MDD5646516.1 diacylglycerol kinase family lipid kinase [Candidatus Bipolaricaulis sp.]
MRRYFVIVNPVSGRGDGAQAIPRVEQELSRLGLDFQLVRTERPWHAAELARKAATDGFDVVVSVGGDGTANEVLNGLMQAKAAGGVCPVMGALCVGRGNDFAFGVGVPRDLVAGCRSLVAGHERRIDVGCVRGGDYPEGRYFGNGVGIGFDTVVGFEAQKLKRVHGFAAYLIGALKTIFLYFRAPLVRIVCDERTIEQQALLVSIMNGRRMGGGFFMAPHGKPDDGRLDLCIAGQVTRRGVLALMPRFMKGTQAGHPAITMVSSRRVSVEAIDGSLPAHADGETICTAGTHLDVELLSKQISILVSDEAVNACVELESC